VFQSDLLACAVLVVAHIDGYVFLLSLSSTSVSVLQLSAVFYYRFYFILQLTKDSKQCKMSRKDLIFYRKCIPKSSSSSSCESANFNKLKTPD